MVNYPSTRTIKQMDITVQLVPVFLLGFALVLITQTLLLIKDIVTCQRRSFMSILAFIISITFASGLFFMILPPLVDKLLNKTIPYHSKITNHAEKVHSKLTFISDLHADSLM